MKFQAEELVLCVLLLFVYITFLIYYNNYLLGNKKEHIIYLIL